MADRTVKVTLRAEVDAYIAGMKRAQSSTSQFGRELTGQGKTVKADLDQIGRGAALMAGGMAVAIGASAKAAMDWESAWAGVTKTVDGSASEMADLESGLRGLAKVLPATHGEIAAVAEAAGQLGIQRGAIEGFTKTMIDLGETTNLTADQAATSMARMANIMGTAPTDIDRMASTLVALGNAGASTESEILDMSMRIAGAAKQVGITEAATLGFANALSSVGVEAEAGGTAISRVFSTIATEVATGGAALDEFARVSGMSSAAFRRAFQEDAAGATISFIEGLGRIKGEGENVFAVLQDLELGDIRVRDALLRASSAGDLFRESLALGADEWERNIALTTEAEKRYDTTAAKLKIARNNVTDLAINIGGLLLPALGSAAEAASTMAQGFSTMPGPMEGVALGIGGIATAGLGAAAAAALLVPKILQMRTALLGMGAAGRVAAASMPWLAAAAAAVGAVSFVFGQQAKRAEEAEARVKGYTDAIREAGDATAGTQDQIATLVAESPELARLLEAAEVSATELGMALSGSDAGFDAMRAQLLATAEASGITGLALESVAAGIDAQRSAALQGAADAETLGVVLDDTGASASGAADGIDGLTGGLEDNAKAAEEARKQFKELLDAYRASVDPLFGMLDALDSNRDAQDALSAAMAANTDDIKDNNVSVEEMNRLYRDVASSAMDVEVAARELAFAVEDGTVSVEDASTMLAEWVKQGLITEDQAANVAYQFAVAAGKADEFAGDYVARAIAETATAEERIAAFRRMLDSIPKTVTVTLNGVTGTRPNVDYRTGSLSYGGATGGLVPGGLTPIYRAAGGAVGTDTIPMWGSHGEFMQQKSAVDRYGLAFMESVNAGTYSPASGGGTTVINQVTVSAGNIVGDHRELVRVVQQGMDEASRLTAGAR